jgi:hypothetical protein
VVGQIWSPSERGWLIQDSFASGKTCQPSLPGRKAAQRRWCRQRPPRERAAANLRRDLPPYGEACFPFIPFRCGTSLRTGGFASCWGGRCPPQQQAFCAAAHQLPSSRARHHNGIARRLRFAFGPTKSSSAVRKSRARFVAIVGSDLARRSLLPRTGGACLYGIVTVIWPAVRVILGEVARTVTATGGVELTVTEADALAEPPGPLALIV